MAVELDVERIAGENAKRLKELEERLRASRTPPGAAGRRHR